ncbi:hypothetical protein M8J76_004071 [Diaphorina citri]|nr:hypothetical protein M8J76_004071 [Diaphorina citri]
MKTKSVSVLVCIGVIVSSISLVFGYRQNDQYGSSRGCSISTNRDLPNPQGLLLSPYTLQILYPEVGDKLLLDPGEEIRIACPGGYLKTKGGKRHEKNIVKCKTGNEFQLEDEVGPLYEFQCSDLPTSILKRTGLCSLNKTQLTAGFQVLNQFIPMIEICFDELRLRTLYTKHTITPDIQGRQINFPRKFFVEDEFFKNVSVSRIYSKNRQTQIISEILQSRDLLEKYAGDDNIARGHLTPKGDFIYGAEQMATFYYVNAAPQWHKFNAGNWNDIEESVRRLAIKRKLALTVYTGSYGVVYYPDKNNINRGIYLAKDKKNQYIFPVPNLFWKVVHEPRSQAGIALVGHNNLYWVNETDILCPDVSSQVPWLSWERTNVKKGFAYACEVDTFRRKIGYLPKFTVTKLLV